MVSAFFQNCFHNIAGLKYVFKYARKFGQEIWSLFSLCCYFSTSCFQSVNKHCHSVTLISSHHIPPVFDPSAAYFSPSSLGSFYSSIHFICIIEYIGIWVICEDNVGVLSYEFFGVVHHEIPLTLRWCYL